MSRKGFTLVELVVAISLGSFILLISGAAILSASRIFGKTSGRDQAFRDLSKARTSLERDVSQLSLEHFTVVPAPSSLGAGADGDALDFLSAVNVTDGKIVPLQDGSGNPYYFLNILYYASIPTNHDALYGQPCQGANEGGYDYNCPHKVLMRAVEDENAAFDPADNNTQDQLLPSLASFLTRPTGFPKAANRRVVATGLLTFQVRSLGAELEVDLRAVSISDARRKVSLGNTSFRAGPYTIQHRFSVFPKN